MRILHDRAYAKINLYLRVGARREDGYHELTTVFQTVSLCDELSLTLHRRGGISLRTNLPWLPRDGRNLAWRAAELFFERAGIQNEGLYLNIRKNVPVGAGMAGGSTDAAAVLRTLNRAFRAPFTPEQLAALGLELGADVPFCLTGGAALAGGVGERLRPVPALPDCPVVIVKPAFSVSTKQAFGLFDAFPPAPPGDERAMLAALEAGDPARVAAALENALEGPVAAAHPAIAALRERLLACGALGARMTGSGSAIFGLFGDERTARAAHETLKKQYRETYLARPRAGGAREGLFGRKPGGKEE